jgi:predicted RNA-binding protein with RPS1 domain
MDFGAFIQLPGYRNQVVNTVQHYLDLLRACEYSYYSHLSQGLVHISQIKHFRIETMGEAFEEVLSNFIQPICICDN